MDETEDGRFVQTELGPVWKPAGKKRQGIHPHTKLKADARAALSLWKKRTGISAYYLPYFVGRAHLGEGRQKRAAYIGKKGAADSFIALLGTVVAAEAKTGSATLKPDQIEFRRRWEKCGLPFVEYRTPTELTDFLSLLAAERGKIF